MTNVHYSQLFEMKLREIKGGGVHAYMCNKAMESLLCWESNTNIFEIIKLSID